MSAPHGPTGWWAPGAASATASWLTTASALGFMLAIARTFGRQLASGDVDACRERLDGATHAKLLEAP